MTLAEHVLLRIATCGHQVLAMAHGSWHMTWNTRLHQHVEHASVGRLKGLGVPGRQTRLQIVRRTLFALLPRLAHRQGVAVVQEQQRRSLQDGGNASGTQRSGGKHGDARRRKRTAPVGNRQSLKLNIGCAVVFYRGCKCFRYLVRFLLPAAYGPANKLLGSTRPCKHTTPMAIMGYSICTTAVSKQQYRYR